MLVARDFFGTVIKENVVERTDNDPISFILSAMLRECG